MRICFILVCLFCGITVRAQHWAAAADSGYQALNARYWSASQQYYKHNNTGNNAFDYWWNAHAADILADRFLRTHNQENIRQLDLLLEGIYRMNGNSWFNDFYDDEQWLTLALLRAYEATRNERYAKLADTLWTDIKKGWTPALGGGFLWMKTKTSKNACSNGPAMIIAARRYQLFRQPEDLALAKNIYQWQEKNLVNAATGGVWDNIEMKDDALQTNRTEYTYNQGTWLGGALELYRITGEQKYLAAALRTARYVMNDTVRFSPQGILKGENSGDGGLFKGIFIRYFTQLLLHGDLNGPAKTELLTWLRNNGRSLLEKGIRRPEYLFDTRWRRAPAGPGQDASIQMSGIMLFEALVLAGG